LRLKILKKLIASLNSEFTGSYKKKVYIYCAVVSFGNNLGKGSLRSRSMQSIFGLK